MSAAVGSVNVIAVAVFAFALCWRLDQIRRQGGGLQPLAMTVSIAALTLAFVVSDARVAEVLDALGYSGASRVAFYALLAVGVAALIVVFFFPGEVTRERRAGIEAIPLVAAIIGLQVTMLVVPLDLRTETLSEWSMQNWGFALFFLIASGYLAYGFLACVRSVRRFLQVAEGYLKVSLRLLVGGLLLLAIGSVAQIVYVGGTWTGIAQLPWLLQLSRIFAILGVVGFLIGISFPLVYSRWQSYRMGRRRRRQAAELEPLWQLITTAVPEVVLPTSKLAPTAELHRRVVETRDGLTQLSPYLPPVFEYASDEVRADLLRSAAADRESEGPRTGAVRDLLPADGDGLEEDVEPLLRLARLL